MRHQPVVLVAAERRAVVHAHVHPTVVAEDERRGSRRLEGGGVMIGVRIRESRFLVVEPPGLDRPGAPAVCGSRRGQVTPDPHRVARRIERIDYDRLVVPALSVADVHIRHAAGVGDGHGIRRDLRRIDAIRGPGLSSVGRAVDVFHLVVKDGARVGVDHGFTRYADGQGRATVGGEDVAGIRDRHPGRSAIGRQEERRRLSALQSDERGRTRLRRGEPSRAGVRDAPHRPSVEGRDRRVRGPFVG